MATEPTLTGAERPTAPSAAGGELVSRGGVIEPVPHVVAWNLTQRCNFACAHCYIAAVRDSPALVESEIAPLAWSGRGATVDRERASRTSAGTGGANPPR